MGRLFDTDNIVWRFLGRVADLVILNFFIPFMQHSDRNDRCFVDGAVFCNIEGGKERRKLYCQRISKRI